MKMENISNNAKSVDFQQKIFFQNEIEVSVF